MRRSGRPLFVLVYEELAVEQEASLRKLCTVLQLKLDQALLASGRPSSSHIPAGNRPHFKPLYSATIS